jgi:hypothetical protein
MNGQLSGITDFILHSGSVDGASRRLAGGFRKALSVAVLDVRFKYASAPTGARLVSVAFSRASR